MFRPPENLWCRALGRRLLSASAAACLLAAPSAVAQAVTQRQAPAPGKEIIEVGLNGETLPTLGLPSISLPPVSSRFTIYMKPEHPRRRQYLLEGVDSNWKEMRCEMAVVMRFLNAKGEVLLQDSNELVGESPGWNGGLENPVFAPWKTTVTAPPGAHRLWFIITSAGPPDALGVLLIRNVKIFRTRGREAPELVLRAPVGRDPHTFSPVQPAPFGFTGDGKRPRMAKLHTLASPTPGGLPNECFAIFDDDIHGHAEWRTLGDYAPLVQEGDRLDIEWEQAYSVGGGTLWFQDYHRPRPGNYRFRVRPLDLQGLPNGEETTLSIHILPPWWQQGWVWSLAAATILALAFALHRYIAHQRIREELTRMKETALRKAEVELARMARASTLGEFTASIVHEISQPLTAITANANTCMRWLNPERCDVDEARAATQRIIGDSDRAVKIVMRIRALLAKEKPIRESSSINAVIEELLPLLKTDIRRRGVTLECHLGDELPDVAIDRVQIQQVVMNLVINGLDAMNGISDRPRILRVHTGRDAEFLLVKVEDSGMGLDPATIDRLFDRFFTTKPDGLGMGLAICQSIIASHEGRLLAKPNEGPGATFQFTLPIETRILSR